jgi:RES domain-containing protein
MSRRRLHHDKPLFRVVRAGWKDPLDASFSLTAPDRRWNTPLFPALYCCCSHAVARGITRDLLKLTGADVEDLQPSYRPRLVELSWKGDVVDVATPEGVGAAGFPADYPAGVSKMLTRAAASDWHEEGDEGVVCRSASLWRMGFSDWSGPHLRWSELAIFVENCASRPTKRFHRDDLRWLVVGGDDDFFSGGETGGEAGPAPPHRMTYRAGGFSG